MKKALDYFNGDTLAADVWSKKYRAEGEVTPTDMHRRLASEFARIESNYPNACSEETIFNQFDKFARIVPQGSPMAGIGNGKAQSLSNCVVIEPPKDSMSDIVNTAKDMANLYKNRAGVGISLNELRPESAAVSNSAKHSSGAWSFADFFSNVTRMVGQDSRRGALMIMMSVHHPDIAKFVTMKHNKTRVTGANISVQVTDDFMQAVENDECYYQCFPLKLDLDKIFVEGLVEGVLTRVGHNSYIRKVRAKEIWDTIVDSATTTAEPGIVFWDTMTGYLPSHDYPEFETTATNPCGEIGMGGKGSSCRLISINLKNFVRKPFTEEANFDFDAFEKTVRIATRLTDDLVDLELEKVQMLIDKGDPDEKILFQKLYDDGVMGRRVGLGTHGLADAIARMGEVYGQCNDFVDTLYKTLKETSYDTSVTLAKERGPFQLYDPNIEEGNKFLEGLSDKLKARMAKYGRRNVALLTNAPTGSVSILSQTSSGMEPVFKTSYTRRRKLNADEMDKATFIADDGEKFVDYKVYHHNAQEYLDITGETELPAYFVEAEDVKPENRVALQAAMQHHIDHSISSCLVGDTLIDTDKGLKKIVDIVNPDNDDLEVGFRALSEPLQVRNCHNEIVDVGEGFYNGEHEVYTVGFIGGKTITATKNHKFYVSVSKDLAKWVELQDLAVGDAVVCKRYDELNAFRTATRFTSATIKSIKYHGVEKTYDISVPDGNSYVANGLVVHNTVNLPKGTLPSTVNDIYFLAWKNKLKGITVYVDGSREGVLIKNNDDVDKFVARKYTERPDSLECDIHYPTANGQKYVVMISLLNGRPYEVFAGLHLDQVTGETGYIVRRAYKSKPNKYDLHCYPDAMDRTNVNIIPDIVAEFNNPDNAILTRMLSLALRYGSQVQHSVEQLQASDSMFGYSRVLARVLKKYIPNGTKAANGKICSECSQDSLIYEEGCVTCKSCGWTKCT